MRGKLAEGQRIAIYAPAWQADDRHAPDGDALGPTDAVLERDVPGRPPVPRRAWLPTRVHGPDRVRFVQDETFSGLLVPLYSRLRGRVRARL